MTTFLLAYFGNHLFASRIRHPRYPNITVIFVNTVFSYKDKILIQKLYHLKGYNVRQLRTKYPEKVGRQEALTVCSRSSQTQAHTCAAADCKVPMEIKTLTSWTTWFWVKRTSPALTAQSVKYHRWQAFPSYLLSASYERISSWSTFWDTTKLDF